jgi:tetratricopeptide (TPR) repeat protein/tRNA A-37 threonylcarbamoyl transferase component Bud32
MNEQEIFHSALALPPEARADYLERVCAGDAALRASVEGLLRADEGASSFLGRPPAGLGRTVEHDAVGVVSGTVIAGRYKLLEQIGEGGMGTVWVAEQREPVKRKVALKLVKPGMDSKSVVARFEAERQALALMDHQNIAKVLDGGATEAGRPFFVMELVDGKPLTEYCDARRLSVRERLELFVPICQAVQHAHQKGIIHRDLKPSNILVTEHEGRPVPKVIDFGLAKALSEATVLTERTLHTAFGTVVGTPLYMAPEQVAENALDVDTRTDVYSLGVILYELLTGTTPLEKQRLKEAAWDEIRRVIREEEPPKPSMRLSDSHDSLPSISALRHTEPALLTRLVRGELDWIVMKALEKDRNRRYETANGFSMDVQRYLADEPVHACPPSKWYRVRKFVRRNKGSVAVTSAFALAVLIAVGAVAGSLGWAARVRAERQAKEANQLDLIVEEVERFESEQRWPEVLAAAKRAEAVIASGDVDDATRRRALELLKDVAFIDRLEQVRMASATWLAKSFDFAGADRKYADAFREYGVDVDGAPVEQSIERLKASRYLAVPLAAALDDWNNVRGNLKQHATNRSRLLVLALGIDADPLRRRLRSIWEKPASEAGEELHRLAESINVQAVHPTTLSILCDQLVRVGRADQAVRLFQDAQRAHPGDFWINFNLADLLADRKDFAGAVRFLTSAVSLRPRATAALTNLGAGLTDLKRLDEAKAVLRRALEIDPKLAIAHGNLGNALYDQNRFDEAAASYREAIELNPTDAFTYRNLGMALSKSRRLDEAVAAYRMAIELNPRFAQAYNGLASVLNDQNNHDEAVPFCRKAIEINPKLAVAHSTLGDALVKQKKLVEAVAAFRKALEFDSKIAGAHNGLGNVLYTQNKFEEAAAAYQKAIDLEPKFAGAHNNLGLALLTLKKPNEAIAAYRKAIETDPNLAFPHANLGNVLREQKKLDEAVAEYRKAVELDPKLAVAYKFLGLALRAQKKPGEAIIAYRKAIELDQNDAGVYHNLGVLLLLEVGEYEPAVECFRKAVELEPNHSRARTNLVVSKGMQAFSLVDGSDPKRRDPKQARELIDKMVDSAQPSNIAWQFRGWILYRLGDWNASVEALEKSCQLGNGGDAGQWIVLALAHAKLATQNGVPASERVRHLSESGRRYEAAIKQIDNLMRAPPPGGPQRAVWNFRVEARALIETRKTDDQNKDGSLKPSQKVNEAGM